PCGVTFLQLDHYLRHGIRGLGPGSSLYQEVKAVAAATALSPPDRDYDTTPLTEAQVQAAIGQHYETNGETPRVAPAPSPLGMNWDVLDRYLRQGRRGLPGGSSLPKQVAAFREARGLAVEGRPGPLTHEDVHEAIRAYFGEHRQRPTRSTPGQVPRIGITWGALENLLKRGGRGLG